jgi:hypothetical protein
MFVLVLVVVGVALGNRDNLGNAERNEKTFLHLFFPSLGNPWCGLGKRTKKVFPVAQIRH